MGVMELIGGRRWHGTSGRPADHLGPEARPRLLRLAQSLVEEVEQDLAEIQSDKDVRCRMSAFNRLSEQAVLLREAALAERDGCIREMVTSAERQGGPKAARAVKQEISDELFLSRSTMSKILVADRIGTGASHRAAVVTRFTTVDIDPAGCFVSGPDWLAARFFFEGRTTAEIAAEAGCAQKTVSTYLSRLFDGHPVYDRRTRDGSGKVTGRFSRLPAELRGRHRDLYSRRGWREQGGSGG